MAVDEVTPVALGPQPNVADTLPQLPLDRRRDGRRERARATVRRALAPGVGDDPEHGSPDVLAGFAAVLARYGRSGAVTFGCVTRAAGLFGLTVEIDPEVRPRPWIDHVSDAVASVANLEMVAGA